MTTIAIPVFKAAQSLSQCLLAVDRTCPVDQQILLIDDGSNDAAVDELIDRFCDRPSRRAVVRRDNRGFVATANEAMSKASGDVLLLNSDTQVAGQWLIHMEQCLASDPAIATVTPFSNNAEICSFPLFCRSNPVPENPDALAQAIAATPPVYPTIPTAVGFCMLIRRHVIDDIGVFDEATFGMGYGEENDFSRRAASKGYRNVLADNAYVVHVGGQSFAEIGLKPDQDAMNRLLSLHPDYLDIVMEFIHSDPLAGRRQEILQSLPQSIRDELSLSME